MKYIVESENGDFEFKNEQKAIEKAKTLKGATVTAWESSGTYRSKMQIWPVKSECQSWHV